MTVVMKHLHFQVLFWLSIMCLGLSALALINELLLNSIHIYIDAGLWLAVLWILSKMCNAAICNPGSIFVAMQFGKLHRTVSRLDLVTYRNLMKHKVCMCIVRFCRN